MTANAIINNIGHNPIFVWKIPKMVSQMEKECCKGKVKEKMNCFWFIPLDLLWIN